MGLGRKAREGAWKKLSRQVKTQQMANTLTKDTQTVNTLYPSCWYYIYVWVCVCVSERIFKHFLNAFLNVSTEQALFTKFIILFEVKMLIIVGLLLC